MLIVKEIYVNNAPTVYGVFPTSPSRFDGSSVVRFGTRPVSTHDTREEAEAVARARGEG